MTTSVYAQVLGSEIDLLVPELRNTFSEGTRAGRGVGVFTEAGSRVALLRPILSVMARQRVLFPEYGRDVPFELVNRPTPEGGVAATRTFFFPSVTRILEDTLIVVDGRLHDFMGPRGGFEVEMDVRVENGGLQMQSARQWLRVGRLRVRIPPPATVAVTESWRHGRRHIEITLRSIILGEWFRYVGSFDYQFENR